MQESSGQVQYAGENRWLIILLAAVAVVVMQEMLKTMPELQIKIPDVIVYSIAGIGLVYAGFLSMLSGTTAAKLFRGVVVIAVGISIVISIYAQF
ncbi:hypothetical protein ACTUSZ_19075 [Pantoea eucalypti]|uniref:hypothetical protein n=1 Tax=Pantoea TaxID=53335 RepID=UPI003C7D5CCB